MLLRSVNFEVKLINFDGMSKSSAILSNKFFNVAR